MERAAFQTTAIAGEASVTESAHRVPRTGAEHYLLAGQLLEHARFMLDTEVAPEHAAELVQRQIAVATLGQAHALLAAAAAIGLSSDTGPLDMQAWRDAASTRPER